MLKNKKWIVLLIVIFPSLLWIILETSTINSNKLPHYGPKTIVGKGDTIFYKTDPVFFKNKDSINRVTFDTTNYPILALMFIKDSYKNDAFRISGFWEYVNYKKDKIQHIPFVLITEAIGHESITEKEIYKMSENADNITFATLNKPEFDSINKTFFIEKPYYVDYSFFVLLDKKRHIRGYYDARYVSEVKRLIDEYQHLRLKEEKQLLIKDNEIKHQ